MLGTQHASPGTVSVAWSPLDVAKALPVPGVIRELAGDAAGSGSDGGQDVPQQCVQLVPSAAPRNLHLVPHAELNAPLEYALLVVLLWRC
jgi:hypothetical protein